MKKWYFPRELSNPHWRANPGLWRISLKYLTPNALYTSSVSSFELLFTPRISMGYDVCSSLSDHRQAASLLPSLYAMTTIDTSGLSLCIAAKRSRVEIITSSGTSLKGFSYIERYLLYHAIL